MSWPPKNILVGTDFSASSEAALHAAAAIARRDGARIELVHVLPPRLRPLAGFEPLDVLISPDPVVELEATERRASELAQRWAPGLCRVRVIEGEPVSMLVTLREELDADLVVLGAGGLRGARHFFLGSVAEKMLDHPGCPLLLTTRTTSAGEFKRVLIAQESPRSKSSSLEIAVRLARDERSEVIALHVAATSSAELERQRASAGIAARIGQIDPTAPAQVIVRRGDPAREIVRAAREFGADLVVLGAEQNRPDFGPGAVVKALSRSDQPALLIVWPSPTEKE
ncbi:MAG TPA: universal stress protein [Myxococcota bacterium]|nr:universal stress protein [Myxococcota bacterium]